MRFLCVRFNTWRGSCYGYRDAPALWYLQGSKEFRLRRKGHDDPDTPLKLVGYIDADSVADKADRRSITGGCIELVGMPVVLFTRKQSGVSLSTI